MPVTITCFGGVREIGGNKILLEDESRDTDGSWGGRSARAHDREHREGGHEGGRRVMFDFGQSFDRHSVYFDGVFLRERTGRGLLDPIALGLVPPLRGLLREDAIPVLNGAHIKVTEFPPTGRQKNPRHEVEVSPAAVEEFWEHWKTRFPGSYRDLSRESGPAVDFLLLSHTHLDHTGDVQYIKPDVPAYSTRLTAAISKVIMDVGQAGRSGPVYVNPCECSPEGVLKTESSEPMIPRPWGMVDGEFGGAENVGRPAGGFTSSGVASGGHISEGHTSGDHLPDGSESRGTRSGSSPSGGDLSGGGVSQADVAGAAAPGDRLDSAVSFWSTPPSKQGKGYVPREPAPVPGPWLKHWPVDHSLMGAAAFAVETDAGWVAYTGDLRFHGGKGDTTRKFAAELAGLHPVALLCEGTRLPLASVNLTEEEACQNCLKAVKQAEGRLVVADFAARNVERLLSFVRVAGESKRTLLLQPKDAYLLRAMHLADAGAVPDVMEEACVGLYADPKATMNDWERNVVQRYGSCRVGPSDVQQNPGDFVLALSLMDMPDMLDIEFLIGEKMSGVYIFSNSPAFDDEGAIDLRRLMHWTEHLNLEMVGLKWEGENVEPVRGYHSSGHASRRELVDFVKQVNPKMLIPIHTEKPEEWVGELAGTGIEIRQPEVGRGIHVSA